MNPNEQIIASKVWSAIVSHKNLRCLSKMNVSEINYLPKDFIKTLSVWDLEGGWDLLPDYVRNDPLIKRYKQCLKHHNFEEGDQIDGPSPRIIDCVRCVKENAA